MKSTKWKQSGLVILDIVLYVLMFLTLILSSVVLAIFLVKYINKKRQQSQIRKMAVKKVQYEEQKINLVKKLSTQEIKLQKYEEGSKKYDKINKNINKLNIKINNLDKILNAQTTPIETPQSPMMEKFENKLNDISSTLKGN